MGLPFSLFRTCPEGSSTGVGLRALGRDRLPVPRRPQAAGAGVLVAGVIVDAEVASGRLVHVDRTGLDAVFGHAGVGLLHVVRDLRDGRGLRQSTRARRDAEHLPGLGPVDLVLDEVAGAVLADQELVGDGVAAEVVLVLHLEDLAIIDQRGRTQDGRAQVVEHDHREGDRKQGRETPHESSLC